MQIVFSSHADKFFGLSLSVAVTGKAFSKTDSASNEVFDEIVAGVAFAARQVGPSENQDTVWVPFLARQPAPA